MIAKWISGGIKLAKIWNLSVLMHAGMFHIQTEKFFEESQILSQENK